ncbi:MAG: Uncharacterized protein G01um10147_1064 [Microgenomates group bacterium Gr01-1014_7]|nr:MAG: Uncharacterized protein G01um10147_1064 [Microgenomates group bacterium Gr01-1014_7]
MPNTLKEQGFVHLLPILGVAIISTLVVSSIIPVTRQYNDGKSNVAGVYLAKEGDEEIKVATAPGQIALVNKKVGALLNFPLSVNPTTRQLTVTTPAGSKVVAVLPEKAINNMLAAHIMDDVISEKVNNSLASVPELVRLEIKNGILGYQVKGTKTHKLLGVIPLKTDVETFISAENGQVVETSQSLLGRILNRIAPLFEFFQPS